jgi:hypothetical protein
MRCLSLGTFASLDAWHDRTAHSEIAAFALIVDAHDEAAAAFYRHHGFIALPDTPLTLFLPLVAIQRS